MVRKLIQDLTAREFCLYKAICQELDELAEEIDAAGLAGGDFLTLATAMRDRRFLVDWLRELHLPPSSMFGHRGISEAMEERLLSEATPDG